jgi:hypothetical protein
MWPFLNCCSNNICFRDSIFSFYFFILSFMSLLLFISYLFEKKVKSTRFSHQKYNYWPQLVFREPSAQPIICLYIYKSLLYLPFKLFDYFWLHALFYSCALFHCYEFEKNETQSKFLSHYSLINHYLWSYGRKYIAINF